MTFTLFYTPGACPLSPHIALREAGLPFELVKVDLRAKKLASGEDFTAINPKGYVPALKLPNGELLTEGQVMLQYIADQVPAKKLAPPAGTMDRYRLLEQLNFIATELHKGVSPLYNTLASDELKTSIKNRIALRWTVFEQNLKGDYLMGDQFTIGDCYAFYVMRSWQHAIKESLDKWPKLVAYYQRLAQRPSVAAALEAEGLKP